MNGNLFVGECRYSVDQQSSAENMMMMIETQGRKKLWYCGVVNEGKMSQVNFLLSFLTTYVCVRLFYVVISIGEEKRGKK